MSRPVGHGIRTKTKIKQKEIRTLEINLIKTIMITSFILSSILSYVVFVEVKTSSYNLSMSKVVREKFTSGKVTRCRQLRSLLESHCIKMIEEAQND